MSEKIKLSFKITHHFLRSVLQLGQQDFFYNQGTTHVSWKICLHFNNLMTSPLTKFFKQIEQSLSECPIFIFLIW